MQLLRGGLQGESQDYDGMKKTTELQEYRYTTPTRK
jgi:hypothetical protein